MNPGRVRTREEVERALRAKGLEPTDLTTGTGRFWKSTISGRHIQVPEPYDGMYPEAILEDLYGRLDELGFGPLFVH